MGTLTLKLIQEQVVQQSLKANDDKLKECEQLIITFSKQLVEEKDASGIHNLLTSIRPFYDAVGKARASKLIRELVELSLSIDQGNDEKVELLKQCVEWAKTNHREYLRRSLDLRLAKLYNEIGQYSNALKLAHDLSNELKKIEDREMLIEFSLEESKSAFYLNNFAKAKCALVTAKTNANAANLSSKLQAAIDMQSGILHSIDEKDFKTSFSYFYEAFDGYRTIDEKKDAIKSLKYMVLAKIMLNETDQIPSMMATKEIAQFKGKEIDAILKMAEAFRKRCLKTFQATMKEYNKELVQDKVVSVHSNKLEKNMIEKDITRVVEPYSEVELSYIARVVGMNATSIEKAIARMILDKKLNGCIDQRSETVIIYPKSTPDKPFERSLKTIKGVSKVVDAAYKRAAENIK